MKIARYALAVLGGLTLAAAATAGTVVPACRLDTQLTDLVGKAAGWSLKALKDEGVNAGFDAVAVNPTTPQPTRTLSVFVVKDAGLKAVSADGCILPGKTFRLMSGLIPADGPCTPTSLDACTPLDQAYMLRKLREIHGSLIDSSQDGYEEAGACYMTNTHACVEDDRRNLASAAGERDEFSVRGTCLTNPVARTVRCSAGALKMLLSRDAVRAGVPTLALMQVLGHEFGHLVEGVESAFTGGDHLVDLSWPAEDKLTVIQKQCRLGDSLRKSERDADAVGLRIAKRWLPEIARLTPRESSVSWQVSQAVHQSGNLARWNNAWTGSRIEQVRALQPNPRGGIRQLDSSGRAFVDGPKTDAASLATSANAFLCGMNWSRNGVVDVLVQAGSTHGTLIERMASTLSSMRPLPSGNQGADADAAIAAYADLALEIDRKYLAAIEGAICVAVEKPLACTAPAGVFSNTPVDARGESTLRIPVPYAVQPPVKDVEGAGRVLMLQISTGETEKSAELAQKTGGEIAAAYADLQSQVDAYMRRSGGHWIVPPAGDVGVQYNGFAGAYMAFIEINAIARVPASFRERDLPVLRTLKKWGRMEGLQIMEWDDAKFGLYLFLNSPGDGAGEFPMTIRAVTEPAGLGDMFDLTAARQGNYGRPGPFVRALVPTVRTAIERKFDRRFSMMDDNNRVSFHFNAPSANVSFPKEWAFWLGTLKPATAQPDQDVVKKISGIYIHGLNTPVNGLFGQNK